MPPYRCPDRMCGAPDCERCHPGAYDLIACHWCLGLFPAWRIDEHEDECPERASCDECVTGEDNEA